MSSSDKKMNPFHQFFEIRFTSVSPYLPLPYDLYLVVNTKPILFRKQGDAVTQDRIDQLVRHGGERFLIPEDQRTLYLGSLRNMVQDPSTTLETKSKFIKESAFVHIKDLFTKQDISVVVTEAKTVVEDMVSLVSSDVAAVATLMRLSSHDYYTYNHCVDVAVYSIAMARRFFGENKELLFAAGMGGLLHDIGKKNVDLTIINKPGKLTPQEWDEVKRHPSYGKELVDPMTNVTTESKLVVHEHHENYDGTGYPQGLKGDQISTLSRIVTIADVFDALTTVRSYHKAIPAQEALDKMFTMQPGKFDPNIFGSFNKDFEKPSDIVLPANFDPCTPNSVQPQRVGKKK
jgi:HD-GYP domain-containing protein (c-di-GMP phosphodiesterase class II)